VNRRRIRSLRPVEAELWKQVTERTTPLHPGRDETGLEPGTRESKTPVKRSITAPPLFRVGETAQQSKSRHAFIPCLSDELARAPVTMDRKSYSRMKKGRLAPESRIDLHGMTAAQAHAALTRFILTAISEERRLVLVITGKGRQSDDDGPIPMRHGVLRHQVPHWLHTPPLKPYVLQIAEAHLKHGGQGALYVYLRRNRA
jgi:DNA-nicking Smr family endonuclease